MKKLLVLSLCSIMCLTALVGCQENETTETNTTGAVTSTESTNEGVAIASVEDINGLPVAVQESTTGDALATEMFADSEISRFKKAMDCGMDLQNGKVDAVVIDALVAENIVNSLEGLVILDDSLSVEEYAMAFQKGNTELVEAVNESLAELQESGEVDKIYNAFIVADEDKVPLEDYVAGTYDEDLIIGTNSEFAPFEYREGDEIVGYDIEIIKRIADDLEMNLVIEDMNFDSLIPAVSSGKVDLVISGMTATDERRENVDFSETYFNASQAVIVREDSIAK